MSHSVELACKCGKVSGELKVVRNDSFHVKCLCCDCQAFAGHLKNEERVLDNYGGTELFQTYPAYVSITQGHEYICYTRLTDKGLLRHYTSCCNTPIGNVMNGHKVPFVGVPAAFIKISSLEDREQVLGPVIMEAFAKYAQNGKPVHAHERFPLSFMPKIMKFMAKGFIKTQYTPSPFFEDEHPKYRFQALEEFV